MLHRTDWYIIALVSGEGGVFFFRIKQSSIFLELLNPDDKGTTILRGVFDYLPLRTA